MANGPDLSVHQFRRADIGGLLFTSESLEQNKIAKNSVVMIRTDLQSCGGSEFGRVQRFMRVKNPGTNDTSDLADVAWYDIPKPPEDFKSAIKCPVICKTSKLAQNGNYWPLHSIVPTKIILAPHNDQSKWQVLHWDSDFLSRQYGTERSVV